MDDLLKIDPEKEKNKIVSFLQQTFSKQQIDKAVIGLSGGIDSMLSFFLLKEVLPPENIIVAHLFYAQPHFEQIEKVLLDAKIPKENVYLLSIKEPVDVLAKLAAVEDEDKVRKGNISARVRMIMLFDLAKKYNALVCGTENKTENLLGYFTRFGDQASDIEPITTLYKTQVRELAKYMRVSQEVIAQQPTAGLWHGQTDEGEFGFTYQEADQVLFFHLEKGMSVEAVEQKGLKNARKILGWREKNFFKHQVPYSIT